jgi:DNA-binding transcriptional MerR regulator
MKTSVMAYTVGEVMKIAKVSVRALHHWDEIGLVKPSRRSAKGYRLYTDDDLDRLQQVLFYRELGFRLEDIATTMADPAFDRREALRSHRVLLAQRVEHARALLDLVDRALHAMDGEETMRPEEKFEAFDPAKYEDEARERWGTTASYAEAQKRTKRYTEDDWKELRAEADAITAGLAALMEANVPPDDPRATSLAEKLHRLARQSASVRARGGHSRTRPAARALPSGNTARTSTAGSTRAAGRSTSASASST